MVVVTRALRILSLALIVAGVTVLADVAVTLAWKEPISSLYGSVQQGKLEDELRSLEREFPTAGASRAIERAAGVRAKVEAGAERFATATDVGDAIGQIRVPSIDADFVLVEGTDTATLQKGPGRYPDTHFPGQGGTVGIAGHRTTYLAPFRRIDDIEKGDEVLLELPYASFVYRVQRHRIVEPTAVEIVRETGQERLVMTACHPLYSAAQRYAVFARLKSVSLFAAGERRWLDP